jgi:hypothetical protein
MAARERIAPYKAARERTQATSSTEPTVVVLRPRDRESCEGDAPQPANDRLGPVRGIALGLLLSALLWAAGVLVVVWLLR